MAALHPTEMGDAFQEGSALRVAHEARLTETHPSPEFPGLALPEPALPGSPSAAQSHPSGFPEFPLFFDFPDLLRPERMQPQIQRLRFVMRYMHKIMYAVEELAKRRADDQAAEKQQRTAQSPRIPPLPPEGGEYRLFYVSPIGLRMEQEFLERYNAHGLKDLLHLSSSILHSYTGLIHNSGVGPSEMDGVLASMADVLQVALHAVNSAEQLCAVLEPVKL